jgi:hypothetical protein
MWQRRHGARGEHRARGTQTTSSRAQQQLEGQHGATGVTEQHSTPGETTTRSGQHPGARFSHPAASSPTRSRTNDTKIGGRLDFGPKITKDGQEHQKLYYQLNKDAENSSIKKVAQQNGHQSGWAFGLVAIGDECIGTPASVSVVWICGLSSHRLAFFLGSVFQIPPCHFLAVVSSRA